MSEIVNTKRTVVLRRVPPGDRWSPVDDPNIVFESLTKGLEHIFQTTDQREFHLSPLDGFMQSNVLFEIESLNLTFYVETALHKLYLVKVCLW